MIRGTRADFSSASHPQYFDAGVPPLFLYLKKNDLNSYWEMRNAYFLGELAGGGAPADLTVSLYFTGTGAANENYDGLLADFTVDPYFGALLFAFRDAAGFYPRPFPGEYPFYNPADPPALPGNPFSPDNPVYGGLGYPGQSASVNTLLLRYTASADSFSWSSTWSKAACGDRRRVPAGPSAYTVDYRRASFPSTRRARAGQRGEVTYRYAPPGGRRGAVCRRAGGVRPRLAAGGQPDDPHAAGARPGRPSWARAGQRPSNSTDFSLRFGREAEAGAGGERAPGPRFRPRPTAAGGCRGRHGGRAPVHGEHPGKRLTLGSRSGLLPAAAVALESRGAALREPWERRLLGDLLHEVSWDNWATRSSTITARRANNSADQTTGGGPLPGAGLPLPGSRPRGLRQRPPGCPRSTSRTTPTSTCRAAAA
jgi:hypothetical protein